jgi:hypothetical protein
MLVQEPIPGYWYSNIVGQLQQVRVVLHEAGEIDRVMLENISGKRQCVNLDTWYRLDLTLHSPGIDRRRRRDRDDSTEHSS